MSAVITVGIVGTAAAAYGAKRAGDREKAAMAQQGEALEVENEIAKEQWGRFKKTFAPLEERIVSEAQAPVELEKEPGFSRMLAEIDKGYGDVSANVRRRLGGRYQYGAGIEPETQKTIDMQRVSARSGAVADFAKTLKQQRFLNMLNAASIGRGLPATAASAAGSAAGQYGISAERHSAAAAKGWETAGATLGDIVKLWS